MIVKDHVYIGSGAVILPGVTIGHNSMIGAGSVVTKDVPPLSVAVGIPARVVGRITVRGNLVNVQYLKRKKEE